MTEPTPRPPASEPTPRPTLSTDVAVVGGGLAGLVAASTARRAGVAVTLLDTRVVGGRARSTDRRGYRFNDGAHALYDHGRARAILIELGVELSGGVPSTRDGSLWYRGAAHRLPTGPASLMRTTALSARSKVVTAKLLATVGSIDTRGLGSVTFAEWLDGRHLPDDVADLIRTVVRVATYTDAPDQLSADAAVGQLQLAVRGVTYLDDGWQELVDQLVAIARHDGVDVIEHRAASGIHRDGDRWIIAGPNGDVAARSVVLAGLAPAEAAHLLEAPAGDLGWSLDAPMSRASCLDLGTSRPAVRPLLFAVEEPLYLSTHTRPGLVSREVEAAGGGVVQLLRYLGPDEDADPATIRAELEAHARRAGLDPSGPADSLGSRGARDGSGVVEQRYLHAMTVAHSFPTAATGGFAGRPGPEVDGHPGVFIAGDWVGPEALLTDATLTSGQVAARLAARAAEANSGASLRSGSPARVAP